MAVAHLRVHVCDLGHTGLWREEARGLWLGARAWHRWLTGRVGLCLGTLGVEVPAARRVQLSEWTRTRVCWVLAGRRVHVPGVGSALFVDP